MKYVCVGKVGAYRGIWSKNRGCKYRGIQEHHAGIYHLIANKVVEFTARSAIINIFTSGMYAS